ncbi:MAG: helix-turn-helix domain-containing protein [Chitinophagaceae bacterium]|nr:helix-turn-helix domain-containing protein [Chitinophagaceae bacterium]
MRSVSIIVPEHAVLSCIIDAKRLFAFANQFLKEKGVDNFFEVQLVGFIRQISFDKGAHIIQVDKTLEDAGYSDLIIVPAISGDVIRGTQLNRHYFPWLIEQHKKGAEIASFCVGAFIVAATGLLDGKQCSTHWAYANELAAYYPGIRLVNDKIITEQSGIYSSGGGTSYWNLLLYLLEKYTSRQIVIAATKYFLLDIARNSQSAFVMFKGQKEHGDKLVGQVQVFIENNYRGKINIEKMAAEFSIVRRTLERRFKKATKNSIAEYIQRIKIEAAKKEIEMGRKTINEVMYELDYSDKKAFKELFLRITGLTPIEYKKKYGTERCSN